MNRETYEIVDHELRLIDDELGLHLTGPFRLAALPDDFRLGEKLSSGEKIAGALNKEGKVEKAYLELQGKRQGECRLYYPGGELQAQMYYFENMLHGPSQFFGKKGELLSKTWFYLGKQEGKAHQYYLSKKLCSLQRYREGKYDGRQEYFYEDGSPKTLMHYDHGKLQGEVKLYWPHALLKREIVFVHGKREGWDRIWNEKKICIDEGQYKEGLPFGRHIRRFNNGRIREEIHYHTPTRFDRRELDEFGQVIYEGMFGPDLSFTEKIWDKEKRVMREREGFWDGEKLCWK